MQLELDFSEALPLPEVSEVFLSDDSRESLIAYFRSVL